MTTPERSEIDAITDLLGAAPHDAAARDALFRQVEGRFHRMAAVRLRGEAPGHSLQPTMLATDAFLKLIQDRGRSWNHREEFFCAAARVMRQLLVDYARVRKAQRRGGGRRGVSLDEPMAGDEGHGDAQQLVELSELIEKLEAEYPEPMKVFQLHYFMGWELKEIARDILQRPYTVVRRRWEMAKELLKRELT